MNPNADNIAAFEGGYAKGKLDSAARIQELEQEVQKLLKDRLHRCGCWFNDEGRLQEWCKTHAEVLARAEAAEAALTTVRADLKLTEIALEEAQESLIVSRMKGEK